MKKSNINPNYKFYSLLSHVLNADKHKERFQKVMTTIRNFFANSEFDVINRLISAILNLGNMRTSVVEHKDKFPVIYDLLKIDNPKFFTFLLLDKTGHLLSNEEYKARVEALIEFLYVGLVNFVVEKINLKFKEQYFEQFGKDKKVSIDIETIEVDHVRKNTSQGKQPSIDLKSGKKSFGKKSQANKESSRASDITPPRESKIVNVEAINAFYDKMSARTALVIIDSLGFVDVNRYGDYSDNNDNKFNEFTSNLFYESFLNFFNTFRYEKTTENILNEGLHENYKKVNYINNTKALDGLNHLKDLLIQSVTDKQTAFEEIHKLYPSFYKNILQKLNKRTDDLSEDEGKNAKVGRKITGRSSPSPKPKSNLKKSNLDDKNSQSNVFNLETEYVVVEHSFAEFLNYDLEDLYTQNKKPFSRKIRNLLWDNKTLHYSFFDAPERFSTRLQKQHEDQNEFFTSLLNSNVHFFYCLKIPRCKSEHARANAVFLQFRALDFESLIEHHNQNYPYKIRYPFFIDKFNIMAKVAQIDPNLNIDFEKLVRSILTHMFGETHNDLFAFGKDHLYVKERFYLEIDSLLKESGQNSRILGFVEAALRELLSTHVDNKQIVVMIAQKFLRENCGAYPLSSIIKSKEKFVRTYRKYKIRKEISNVFVNVLDEVLDKIEYYPVKKLVTIQSNIRGYLDRKVRHPEKCQEVALALFNQKFNKIRANLQTTINALSLNNQMILSKIHMIDATKMQINIMTSRHYKSQVPRAIKTITQFAKWGMSKIRLRKYLILSQKRRRAAKIITKFLQSCVVRNKIYYNRLEEKRKSILKLEKSSSEAFSSSLNRYLSSKNLATLPLKSIGDREEPVIKKKAVLSAHIFSIEKLNETWTQSDAFSKNLASVLGNIYKDELQRIELSETETLMYTQKQRLVIFKNDSQKIIELKLPNKSDRYTMLNECLVYVEESGVLKSKEIHFSLPNPNQGMNDISFDTGLPERENVFGFTKFRDFGVRKNAILGATECRKICYKDNITNINSPMRVFQFKRHIAHLALGVEFMIAADDSGVVYSSGKNAQGQLGLGNFNDSSSLQIVKKLVENKEIIKSISCGADHVLAITANNKVYGWGSNYWFQFGEKLKNCVSSIRLPRDITSQFDLDKDVKIQAACGKYSSYVLTANKKLLKMGKVSGGLLLERPTLSPLADLAPTGVFIVGLNVQWNNNTEIISLKIFDSRNSIFDKGSMLIPFANSLFELFAKKSQLTLLPYADNWGNVLPLACLNSKLIDVHNKKDASKLNKMVESFLFIK